MNGEYIVISPEDWMMGVAIGLKVTPKAFGSGRRMPIAAKYHGGWGNGRVTGSPICLSEPTWFG